MAKQPYVPPVQGKGGQIFDSIFILVLVYAALLTPLLLGLGGASGGGEAQKAAPTWESLHQNPTMAQQWEKLGYTPKTAEPIINQQFDYSINPVTLIITILVIGGYFFFMLKASRKEYLDVIEEKFGSNGS